MKINQKCDYGCNRSAKYYFKYAKKWCCEKYTARCPTIRKINSSVHITKNLSSSVESDKLCDYGCNQKAKYILNHSKKLCCSPTPSSCPVIKKKNWYSNRPTIAKLKKKHSFFCKIEKLNENDNGELEVQCKYCKKWFIPIFEQLKSRIGHLENKDGNDGSYFYCSDDCKSKCICYNIKFVNKSIINHTNYYHSRKYSIWRKGIFKQQYKEWGINECEKCGNIEIEQLVTHHEFPMSIYPDFAYDLNNGIILCGNNSINKCHSKIHRGICSTYYLNLNK